MLAALGLQLAVGVGQVLSGKMVQAQVQHLREETEGTERPAQFQARQFVMLAVAEGRLNQAARQQRALLTAEEEMEHIAPIVRGMGLLIRAEAGEELKINPRQAKVEQE